MKIKVSKASAIVITRTALRAERLVYVALANKRIRYKQGKSRLVYIGTTKAGARRIAQSAATRAEMLLGRHGVSSLYFHVVTTTKVPGLKSWRLLERGLIIRFRERFGELPMANAAGKNMTWGRERKYFSIDRLDSTLEKLAKL